MFYFITEDLLDVTTMNFSGHTVESSNRQWISGNKFIEPYPMDTFYVKPCMGTGIEMPDFFDSSVPLMSNRLITAFKDLGIDNFNAYPITLKEENTGNHWNNYNAVNFIGKLDVVDRDKSIIDEDNKYLFHSTVLKESANNFLCFRLYKGLKLLVIHEKIAKAILKFNFKSLLIIETSKYDFDDYF